MPATTATTKLPASADAVTEQGLRRLAAAVLVTKEGRPWNALKTALVWMRVSIGIIRDDSETYSPYAFSPLP